MDRKTLLTATGSVAVASVAVVSALWLSAGAGAETTPPTLDSISTEVVDQAEPAQSDPPAAVANLQTEPATAGPTSSEDDSKSADGNEADEDHVNGVDDDADENEVDEDHVNGVDDDADENEVDEDHVNGVDDDADENEVDEDHANGVDDDADENEADDD